MQPSRNKPRELSHLAFLEKVILQTALADELNVQQKNNKGNPYHAGNKLATDRQSIPQPVTLGGETQAVMVCEGVLGDMRCL